MNEEYLAFVDEIGTDVNGNFIYRLYFTYDPESVWGDFFHITPSLIVPDLKPDNNSLSSSAKIKTDERMEIAKNNGCFSMQDCIDGIISLCFFEIDNDDQNKNHFHLDFGETMDETVKKLKQIGIEMYDYEEITENNNEIDTLISTLGPGLKSDYAFIEIAVGNKYEREDLRDALYENGYKLVDLVENEGEYAIRGYMIDVFSFSTEYPYRINFFGDEVEDIFSFDFIECAELEHHKKIMLYRKEICQ